MYKPILKVKIFEFSFLHSASDLVFIKVYNSEMNTRHNAAALQ